MSAMDRSKICQSPTAIFGSCIIDQTMVPAQQADAAAAFGPADP